MRIRSKLFVITITFLLSSCYRPDAQESMQDLRQLQGKWASTESILFNEYWVVKSDTLLIGKGYSMQENDTVFKEELKIYLDVGSIYYAVKVGERDQFISFKLKEAKRSSWVFENHKHDYPNIISYKIGGEKLIATTTNSNGNKKIEFVMKRKQ